MAIWSKRSGKARFPQALLGHLFALLAVAAIAFGLRAIGVFQIEWARGMNDAFDPAQAAGDLAYLAMSDVWFAAIVAFGSLMGVVAAFVPGRTGLEGGAVE
ncbi:hypothetical protein [Haloferula sp. A504]|uniref:hypothetical protein n=1 Tax=Haloferula sp. A504 TaxID=3373601 RepID=UPI0031C4DD1F|nr:hypothetical protein [Verrucomicrobiaceae bacterium E54]